MKTSCEITLGNASMIISANLEGDALAKTLSDGLASRAYRGSASKAFKGIKDRSTLSYADTIAKLKPIFDAEGWTATFSPYTPDSALKEREEMGKVYDAVVAAKRLPAFAKKYNVDMKLDRQAFILAVIEARSTELADLLK